MPAVVSLFSPKSDFVHVFKNCIAAAVCFASEIVFAVKFAVIFILGFGVDI